MSPQESSGSLPSVINILGIDYAECIPWRQGSILYAFCTVKLNTDQEWMTNNQDKFLNFLNDGIYYLQNMLSLRGPFKVVKQLETSTKDEIEIEPELEISSQQSVIVEEAEVEALRKVLLHKQQILGAQGQELEQLQELLEQQQQLNQEALLDIQQQLLQDPLLEDELQVLQNQIQVQQQEVFEQQEEQVERKQQLQERLLQLQLQQQHLQELQQHLIKTKQKQTDEEVENEHTINLAASDAEYDAVGHGIFSDSHLLAIMYTGEMSFLYCKYAIEWDLVEPSVLEEIKVLGKTMLSEYVEAVDKVFNSAGWNCDKAKEYLIWLSELKNK